MSKCFKHISNADDKLEILKNSKALIKNDGSLSKNDSLVQAAEQLLNQYSEQEQQIIQYVLDNKPVEIKGSDELVAQVGQANTQPTESKASPEVSESELNKENDNKQKELTDDQKENFKAKIKNAVDVLNLAGKNMNTGPYVSDINKTIDILDSKGYNEFADSLRRIVIDSGNESILSESKQAQSSNDQANTDGQKTSQSDTFDPLKIKNTQTQLNNRGGYKLIDTDTGREVFEGRSFKTKSEGNKLLKKLQQEALSASSVESTKEIGSTASQSLIEQHKGFFAKVNEGAVTVEQFKNEFESLVANKEAVEIELTKQTKDQLLKSGYISYYHKNEKKDFLVHQAYRGMLSDFFISDKLLSYSMGKDSYVNAIRENVKEQTDAGLKDHSSAYKKAKEERDAYREEALKGMDNPQTLEDYQRVIRQKMDADKVGFQEARMTLTTDQREAYDSLVSEKTRGDRKDRADQQKTELRAAAQEMSGDIVETKHTKTGENLFIVKTAERVERDVYNEWNATAKRMGGYYSAFRGTGAIPGFQFKTRENAEAFLKYLGGDVSEAKSVIEEKRNAFADDKNQTAVERLNEMADRLEEKASDSLSQDRKVNTARRAGMAARAEAKASNESAMAQTMRNIAGAIESGKAKMLDRVRQKVQVELLQSMLSNAHYIESTKKGVNYGEQEKIRQQAPTKETADYVEYPNYTAYRSDLATLGRALLETDGTKKLGQRILKVADDVSDVYLKWAKENISKVTKYRNQSGGLASFKSKNEADLSIYKSGYNGKAIPFNVSRGEWTVILSPSEAMKQGIFEGDDDKRISISKEFGKELVDKIGKAERRGAKISVPWQFESAYDKQKRLSAMGIETPAELRAAIRELVSLREAPKEADKIKEMERKMIGRANDGLDFFPTPANIADEMIEAADIKEGMSVLEPSAGWGHIADRIRESGIEPDVVELSNNRKELLEAKGYNVIESDFMDVNGNYDRIIMNPPFSDRRDMAHIQHAYDLLKPDGRLVAIMGEGVFFGQDKKAQSFREWFERIGGTDEKLEAGTFNDSSLPVNTGVNARMIVIDKKAMFSKAIPETIEDFAEKVKNDLGLKAFNVFETDNGNLELSSIIVNKDEQRNGKGTEALNRLINYADNVGKTIVLTPGLPNDSHGTTSRARLVKFYKRFGFVESKGRNIDYAIGAGKMYREAKKTMLSNDTASKTDTKITGSTVEQVKNLLPRQASKLADKGILNIVQSIKDIPNSVEGFYETGSDKIYLIADSINAKNFGSVLAHELFHRALIIDPKLKGRVDNFKDYFSERYKQASKGLGSSIENMAYKRIINAKTLMEDRPEEFMAYMVSEYMRNPNMLVLKMKRMIERFIGHVRAILIRSGLDLGMIKELTPADLSAMAMRYGTSIQGNGKNISITDKYSVAMPTQITNVAEQGDTWLKGYLNQANKDATIYNLQDRYIDMLRQMERVVKNGGVINEKTNPYLAEELYHQSRQSRIDDFYADEVQPVLNEMHDEDTTIPELEEFLHARHAPSRNAAMAEINPSQDIIDQKIEEAEQELERLEDDDAKPKEIAAAERELRKWQGAEAFKGTEEDRLSLSGMSDKAAADYMDSLEPERLKVLERLGDAMDDINNKTLDIMVDYGLETQETIDTWKRKWEHYVPLHRDEAHPENGNFGHPVGKGFSISGNGVMQATGSNADVTNIMAHITAAREQMITRGEKNKVQIALAEFIKEHPDPDFAEVNKFETHKKIVDGLVEDVRDPFFVQKEKPNVVSYRENGKDRLIVFNDKKPENIRLALSLKNMDGVELDKVESIIGKGTRWLASVNTQYNLVFGIFNLMRDTQGMALNLESTPLHGKQKQVLSLMPKAIKAIFNITRGGNADPRIAKLYADFRHDGGTTGFVQMFDTIEKRSQSLQKELDLMGAGKASKSWHFIIKAIEDFNTIMENGTRFATYMAARDAGLSRMESASLSKNITVNFNRKGAYTTKLGAFYAFFNASMQGTFRTVETLSSDKGKQIMAGGVALGAITTLLGIAAMGDDEWEKIPEFVRERSLIIPTGKKSYVAIPMPLGFHLLPNIGRKFIESFLGSDRVKPQQRLLSLAGSTVGAFNPLGGSDISGAIMPTVMDPALALWRNKDWTGKPVYREDYNSLKPTPGFTRTKDSATWGSKATAELINKATGGTDAKQGLWSPTPDQIDYLIGQIAGGTGREIMKAEQVVESAFTGEELPTYKVPLVGRLIGSTGDGAVEATAYYDNLKRLNEHEAEIKYLKENGNAREVISYTQDNPEVKMLGFAANVEKTIDRMKKQRRVLISRGGNSKVIDQAINAQMKKLNDKLLTK